MHVVVATDGSRQSLAAARHLRSFADPGALTTITVLAVVRPLAAVSFVNELDPGPRESATQEVASFRDAARAATAAVAAVFADWGPEVARRVRSGSPGAEIIRFAEEVDAGLVVVASGGRGLSDRVLLGSTAQRVQQYAPCPVLVVRPQPRRKR
ncbi:universal stress protein [Nocardioides sp. ChNu-153]|uniref:universal stress protein n=1 Tax=unclassified Nocardioides TaxID=2615069 RepID=UPI0024074028|nr:MULTISPECIES: universal stress protein [unclassified Nocardioides]MDN7121382.1 universal stress protein [Nocardioides sp. ChNu-153]